METKLLKGQTAIVTGASRGIGRAIALTLAEEGADVILNGNRQELLEAVKKAAQAKGVRARIVVGNIADPATSQALAACAMEHFGKIDLLINNAGINDRTKTLDLTLEAWKKVLDVNLNGVFYACKAILPLMKEQGHGSIVNITSANGKTPHPNAAPSYGASKAAVSYLTKHFALEFAPYGIRVNAVQCGPIESDMTKQWTPEYRAQALAKIPLHRLGTPEEVAQAVLYLASDRSGFMTGAFLNLSGGKLME